MGIRSSGDSSGSLGIRGSCNSRGTTSNMCRRDSKNSGASRSGKCSGIVGVVRVVGIMREVEVTKVVEVVRVRCVHNRSSKVNTR